MLYIAEVKKQKAKSFMGGKETVFHLLACQQKDNLWSAIPGEETISSDDVTQELADGVLVTMNLGSNRQIQGKVELAGMKVARLLQTFSRQVDKTKEQEREIEEWKDSLTIQLKALNERQENLDEVERELEEREDKLNDLEQERQEIKQLREQWENDRAELEGAWEQLKRERARLENLQQELNGQQRLNSNQERSVRDLVSNVEDMMATAKITLDPIKAAQNLVDAELIAIQNERKTFAQDRQQAQKKQADAEQSKQHLFNLRQQLQEKEPKLLENQQRLVTLQSQLDSKEQIVTYLSTQLQKQSEARDILSRLVINSPQLKIKQEVDTQALEEMPIEQLEEQLASLQKSFDELVSFVKEQEEELDNQLDCVRELEKQLENAEEKDKENIKNELAEEEEGYRYLEKTLVGQRRNIMARENVLEQHKKVLQERQGISAPERDISKVDLSPIFNKIDNQRNYSEDEFHQVNNEVDHLSSQLQELEQTIKQQQEECETIRRELETLEPNWQNQDKEANQLTIQVEIKGELLERREGQLQVLSDNLKAAAEQAEQMTAEGKQNQLSEVKELFQSLIK